MKKRTRILAWLLTAVMMVTAVPTTAFGSGLDLQDETVYEDMLEEASEEEGEVDSQELTEEEEEPSLEEENLEEDANVLEEETPAAGEASAASARAASPQDEEAAQAALDAIVFYDTDDVRGNITLPTEGEGGVTIAWQSDKPDVIDPQGKDNTDYDDMPGGVVTRQDQDTQVTLTATATLNEAVKTKEFTFTVKAQAEQKEYNAYLFGHFTGLEAKESDEQIYFAVSQDGNYWRDLNNRNPILQWTKGEHSEGDGGVRDPYIIRSAEGDKFYLLATDLSIYHRGGWGHYGDTPGSTSLIIWESEDLIHWSEPWMTQVMPDSAGCAWAPEAIYDEKTGEYVVFWSSMVNGQYLRDEQGVEVPDSQLSTNGRHIFYSKTRDFHNFTDPKLYIMRDGIGEDLYDTTMIESNGKFYRASRVDDIFIESSDSVLGDWTEICTLEDLVGLTGNDVEGPEFFKYNGEDKWGLLVDQDATGKGYLPIMTTDVGDTTGESWSLMEDGTYSFGALLKRHGTILPITQEEYDALMGEYGQSIQIRDEEPSEEPVLKYDFEDLEVNATEATIPDVGTGDESADDATMYGAAYIANERTLDGSMSHTLRLNGKEGWMEFPQGFFDGRDQMTISMDVKSDMTSGNFFTFAYGQDNQIYNFLKITGSTIRNAVTVGSWSNENDVSTAMGAGAGNWQNVKIVIDGPKMQLYVDNKLVDENLDAKVYTSDMGQNLLAYLGKSFYEEDGNFKGSFDNVEVYNYAMTRQEITGGEEEETAGMIAEYDFSQTDGTTVTDQSGTGNDAQIKGSGYTIDGETLNLPGGAYGSNAAYVELPTGMFDGQDTLSISLWLKNETGAGNYAAMFFGTTEELPKNYWLLNPANPNGLLKSVITNSTNATAPYLTEYGFSATTISQGMAGPKTDDSWGLYTTVIKPGSITLYYNGEKVGTVSINAKVSDFGRNLVAYLGKSSYHDMFYEGGIRSVKVYAGEWSQEEVTAEYNLGCAKLDAEALQVEDTVFEDMELPAEGARGTTVTWSSSAPEYIADDGKVTRPAAGTGDQEVVLTATVTMGEASVEREFTVTVLEEDPKKDLERWVNEIDLNGYWLTGDITLPEKAGEATLKWEAKNPEYLTADGKVTRPAAGEGNKEAALTVTATLGEESLTKEFHFQVVEAYSELLTYVTKGNTDLSDALFVAAKEGDTYTTLNNGKAIRYIKGGDLMGYPSLFRKADGTYGLVTALSGGNASIMLYDSQDLTSFTNERKVTLTTSGKKVNDPMVIYDESQESYKIFWKDSEGKGYVTTTKDFSDFSAEKAAEYPKEAENTMALPSDAMEENVFQVTKAEYDKVMQVYGPIYNTGLDDVEDVTLNAGEDLDLPETLTATYNDGTTVEKGVSWDTSDLDLSQPGTYTVTGTVGERYDSPLIRYRADPCVTYDEENDCYYFTASYPTWRANDPEGYDRIVLRTAKTIAGLADAEEITIWDESQDSGSHRYIWAPEIRKIGDKWCVLFTASTSASSVWSLSPHIILCDGTTTNEIMDPDHWDDKAQQVDLQSGDGGYTFAIDMTYFEAGGQSYYAWSEKPSSARIYIATVDPSDPTQITSKRSIISQPDYAWEWNKSQGQYINEGPAVIQNGDTVYLCFSGSTVDSRYCVGVVTANANDDLTDPANWTKNPYPILTSTDCQEFGNNEVGPGHNSFTVDGNGNPVIVYHSRTEGEKEGAGDGGLDDPGRHARAKSVHFSADGRLVLNMTEEEDLAPENQTVTVKVTVKADDVSEELLNSIQVPYLLSEDDVLQEDVGGFAITWTSDDDLLNADGTIKAADEGIKDGVLKAAVQKDGKSFTREFTVKVMESKAASVLAYTRNLSDKEQGYAMHLALSSDGKTYTALKDNTGLLFPKTIDLTSEGNESKVLTDPFVFRMKDNTFGVLAVRSQTSGTDAADAGKVLLFTSKDLLSYREVGMLDLKTEGVISDPAAEYDTQANTWVVSWKGEDGKTYRNTVSDWSSLTCDGEAKEGKAVSYDTVKPGIDNAVASNITLVTKAEAEALTNRLLPVTNTEVKLNKTEVETKVGEKADLSDITATAVYSDGQELSKNINWDDSSVDWLTPGEYELTGTIDQLEQEWPVIEGRADPDIYEWNGKYYFIATDEYGQSKLYIREADSIEELASAEDHLILSATASGDGSGCLWAPELHEVNGDLYIFMAISTNGAWDGVQSRILKLEDKDADPTKAASWSDPVRVVKKDGSPLYEDGITLDMTYFEENGQSYVAWAQRSINPTLGSNIMIATVDPSDPGKLTSDPVLICEPDYGWDRRNTTVDEGPYVLRNADGQLYMTFSGAMVDNTYCVGYLKLTGEDLLDRDNWEKSNYPILTSESVPGEYGPGHNSYITDEDGELLFVYHAKNASSSTRHTGIRRVYWSTDGTPVLNMTTDREILPENRTVSVKVKVTGTEDEALQALLNSVTIPNADDIRGNITLPVSMGDAKLTWTSDNEDVVNTSVLENQDYFDTPAGVVTRQDKDTKVVLTVTAELNGKKAEKDIEVTVKATEEQDPYAAYLYVHFNEYSGEQGKQDIFFGVSKNGVDWTALNDNNAVLKSTLGDKKVRDPYIIRSAEGDKFFLIATDLDIYADKYNDNWGLMATQGSQSLIIWESTDLVNWTNHRRIDVASELDAGMVWAPEAVYDEETGEYLVFWSSGVAADNYATHRIYVSKTRDFYTFTEPELYSNPQNINDNGGIPANASNIDASILKEGDKYYRLIKNENQLFIILQSADHLLAYGDEAEEVQIGDETWANRGSLFTRIDNSASGCLESYKNGYEGPTMFKFNDRDEWCIMVDEYLNQARGYIPFTTTDLDEPNSVKAMEDGSYIMQEAAKHGAVIPITQDEYDALMDKWGTPVQEGNEVEKEETIASYDFEEALTDGVVKDTSGNGNDAVAYGKAAYQKDSELDSNVLYLNGSSGTYVELPKGLLDGLEDMTVSMDIKAQTTDTFHFDFATGQDNSRYMFLRVRNDGIRNAITARNNNTERDVVDNTTGRLNKWVNVTVVMEDHKMSLYVNKELVDVNEHVRSIPELGSDLLTYLGRSFYSADPYFKGCYDNVAIYNRALSAEEIAGEIQDVDTSELKALIEEAKGYKEADYSHVADVYADLQEAIAGAEGVLDDADLTQETVEAQISSLTEAINALKAADEAAKEAFQNVVTEVTAEVNEDNQAVVSWKPVDNAKSYRIYRRAADGDSFVGIANASAEETSYVDADVVPGTTYYYTVKGFWEENAEGISTQYPITVKVTIPDTTEEQQAAFQQVMPEVTAEVQDNNQVLVKWEAIEHAGSYRIYRKEAGGAFAGITNVGADVTSYVDTTAEAGKTYYYTVKGFWEADAQGVNTKYPSDVQVYVPRSVEEFQNLVPEVTAKANADKSVTVSWKEIQEAGSYRIYRKEAGGAFKGIANVAAGETSYTDTTAEAGVTYYYTVKAFWEADAQGAFTNYPKDVTVKVPVDKLGTPAVNTRSVNYCTVEISWEKVTGADKYVIYRKEAKPGTSFKSIGTVSASVLKFRDGNAKMGVEYYYTVKAYAGSIYSDYQREVVGMAVPSAPTLSASGSSKGVTITWTGSKAGANAFADGYRVFRKTAGGSWKTVGTVGANTRSFTDTTGTKGTTYYYTVRAYVKQSDGSNLWGTYNTTGVAGVKK